MDTDGTFIDDSVCYQDENCHDFYYSESGIFFRNRNQIIDRNIRKSQNIKVLCTMRSMYSNEIPYRAFYLSQNLEHVLHNKLNVSNTEKRLLAREFDLKYYNKAHEFALDFVQSSYAVRKNYDKSWNFIQINNNSLSRFSNLDILLKELIDDKSNN